VLLAVPWPYELNNVPIMKWIVIVSAVVVAAAALWLGIHQAGLEARVASLLAQNQQLAHDLTNRLSANLDSMQEVQRRLDQTQSALAATEQRLSNLAAQKPSIPRTQPIPRYFPGPLTPLPSGAVVEPRPPASSHSPTGELLTRSWGPEQALGPPDTTDAGDRPTAWATRSPTGGEEWLKLEFQRAVDVAEVRVRETYNPGAISKVTAFLANGQEVTIWEGEEPPGQAPLDTAFPASVPIRSSSVKVYLDTRRVPSWNEIDAVELVGRDGTRQWAFSATASSTYAEP